MLAAAVQHLQPLRQDSKQRMLWPSVKTAGHCLHLVLTGLCLLLLFRLLCCSTYNFWDKDSKQRLKAMATCSYGTLALNHMKLNSAVSCSLLLYSTHSFWDKTASNA
jgi:hypothetical protein